MKKSSKSEGSWRTPSRKIWNCNDRDVATGSCVAKALELQPATGPMFFAERASASALILPQTCWFYVVLIGLYCLRLQYWICNLFHTFVCSRVGFCGARRLCKMPLPLHLQPTPCDFNRFMTFHVQWHWFLHRCNLRAALHSHRQGLFSPFEFALHH